VSRNEFRTEIKDAEGNEIEYYVIAHPGSEGLYLQAQLVKILSPFASPIISSGLDVSDSDAISLISSALPSLSPKDFVDISLSILKYTKRSGSQINKTQFDIAYQANYAELFSAILFVLKSNYGDLVNFFLQAVTSNIPLTSKIQNMKTS
jgi:hypothetical protein